MVRHMHAGSPRLPLAGVAKRASVSVEVNDAATIEVNLVESRALIGSSWMQIWMTS